MASRCGDPGGGGGDGHRYLPLGSLLPAHKDTGEKITKLHPINGFSARSRGHHHPGGLGPRAAGIDHARGHLSGHRHRSGQPIGRGKLESLPCYHAGLVVTLPFCAIVAAGFYYLLNLWM